MELFLDNSFKNRNKIFFGFILLFLMLQSCATHHAQFGKNIKNPVTENATDTSKIVHTFFLVGDAGNANEDKAQQTLGLLFNQLKKADKNSTLLFLGDNIYPKGLPNTDHPNERIIAEEKLTNQLKLSKNFEGKTIFIPGNHDWYSGIKGLDRQAKFVTDYLNDKKSFLPRKSCAIDDVEINKNLTLVTIDSQWFLEDWDKSPTINDDCSIKTREAFFDELESILNKNQDKTVVLALHHPLMTNGTHGGQFSLEKQLFPLEQKIPLPIIGSVINLIRKTSGISPQDIQNKQYTLFIKRIKTLLQGQDNVIVVSGHDHNLQYINKDNIKQIISGAGSKSEAAKAVFPDDFSYGGNGFAALNIYENGAARVTF
jgi:predicted phosphohydrolase